MNDVIINKTQSIQRCIERVREEYRLAGDKFREDYTRQDAAIMNITRACEQAIDLANHVIKTGRLGLPTTSSESFVLLAEKRIISDGLAEKMRKMVSFRNITVHQYQKMNIEIVEAIIQTGLSDLLEFTDCIHKFKP